jgi:hypothetical protein
MKSCSVSLNKIQNNNEQMERPSANVKEEVQFSDPGRCPGMPLVGNSRENASPMIIANDEFDSNGRQDCSSLSQHEEIPQTSNWLKCKQCCRMFRKSMFVKHLKPIVCINCQEIFTCPEMMELHKKDCLWRCTVCSNIKFSCLASLDAHRNKCHPEPNLCWNDNKLIPAKFSCSLCGINFPSEIKLKNHKKSCKKNPTPRLTCDICKRIFSSKGRLSLHFRKQHDKEKFRCTECGKSFADKSEVDRHIYTHRLRKTIAPCSICGKLLKESMLERHLRNCAPIVETETEKIRKRIKASEFAKWRSKFLSCPDCNFQTFRVNALDNHKNFYHPLKTKHCWHHNKVVCARAVCQFCNRKFFSKEKYVKHEKGCQKNNLKPLNCVLHKETTPSKISMDQDTMQARKFKYKYECKGCDKSFPTVNLLCYHEYLVHPKGDLVSCDVCSRLVPKMSMDEHKKWNPSGETIITVAAVIEREATFNCHSCCFGRDKRAEVVSHVIEKHCKNQPALCPYCEKLIENPQERRNHYCPERPKSECLVCLRSMYEECIPTHSIISKCQTCQEVFFCETLYRNHVDRKQSRAIGKPRKFCTAGAILKDSPSLPTPAIQWKNVQYADFNFSCDRCHIYFENQAGLDCHKDVFHSQWYCEFCGDTYLSRQWLRKHLFNTHRISTNELSKILFKCKPTVRSVEVIKSKTYTNNMLALLEKDFLRSKNNLYCCPICKLYFDVDELLGHIKSAHFVEVKFKTVCVVTTDGKIFNTLNRLRLSRFESIGIPSFKCGKCSIKKFFSESDVQLHIMACHVEMKAFCYRCHYKSKEIQFFPCHIVKRHPYVLDFVSKAQRFVNEGMFDSQSYCSMCFFKFASTVNLTKHIEDSHMRRVKGTDSSEEKIYCTKCDDCQLHHEGIFAHYRAAHRAAACNLCGAIMEHKDLPLHKHFFHKFCLDADIEMM